MSDLVTLAKYPFLPEAKEYVKSNALSVEEILDDPLYARARLFGIERLENAFQKRDVGNRSLATESDCIMELLSYPIARMITVCIDDIYFTRRYALSEAIHTYKNLVNESTNFLMNLSKAFNFTLKKGIESEKLHIHFSDYVHYAPTRYKKWKMINRQMEKGYITISRKELARLIQEALRSKINAELDGKYCSQKILQSFSREINNLKNKVLTYRKKIEAAPIGKVDIKKFPPCMTIILSAVQSGENVPHMARFALVAFLHSLQLQTTDIIKLFSRSPDFEEDKTRYQIEHITGTTSSTSYKPPGCEKMRTYGICPIDKIDDTCNKTRHPLSYYKAKWKKEEKKGEIKR